MTKRSRVKKAKKPARVARRTGWGGEASRASGRISKKAAAKKAPAPKAMRGVMNFWARWGQAKRRKPPAREKRPPMRLKKRR